MEPAVIKRTPFLCWKNQVFIPCCRSTLAPSQSHQIRQNAYRDFNLPICHHQCRTPDNGLRNTDLLRDRTTGAVSRNQRRVGSDRVAAYYKQNCDVSKLGECFPSGKELDDALSAASTKANNDRATIAYFSPASQCPDSYTTAGSAHRGSDGNVTSSGVFVPPVVTSGLRSGGLIGYNPPLNVLMEVLDEDEIAIVCCPE